MKSTTTHKTPQRECCHDTGCESGLRNNYFEGKRLTADSFRVEQKYSLDRRRLLNRAIHGWGVVYGYAVKAGAMTKPTERNQLNIGPGLALDICGRELLQTDQAAVSSDLIVLDKNNERLDLKKALSDDKYKGMCWMLSVHYAEELVDHMNIPDSCRCEHDEWDRTCETVRYTLRPVDCKECCKDFPCELECDCGVGPCCEERRHDPKKPGYPDYLDRQQHVEKRVDIFEEFAEVDRPAQLNAVNLNYPHEPPKHETHEHCKPSPRGGCRCLCDHLINLKQPDCGPLCEIEEPCGRVWVDLNNGVDIACVVPGFDDCDRVIFQEVEECGPRRLVKRNDLLFDLIRGCDLTYIKDFGWAKWHRHTTAVPYPEFRDAFGPGGGGPPPPPEYVTRDFWVEFSRPVRRDTVQEDCFVMTIITVEDDDRWWETSRVPIRRVEMANEELIERATIVVDGKWLRGAIRSDSSRLERGVTRVEVEVRGDFIVDCNGQTIDANPRGLSTCTGNGTPGGTFLSTFLVEKATAESSSDYKSEERSKGVS
jgi:hypothetical protein